MTSLWSGWLRSRLSLHVRAWLGVRGRSMLLLLLLLLSLGVLRHVDRVELFVYDPKLVLLLLRRQHLELRILHDSLLLLRNDILLLWRKHKARSRLTRLLLLLLMIWKRTGWWWWWRGLSIPRRSVHRWSGRGHTLSRIRIARCTGSSLWTAVLLALARHGLVILHHLLDSLLLKHVWRESGSGGILTRCLPT